MEYTLKHTPMRELFDVVDMGSKRLVFERPPESKIWAIDGRHGTMGNPVGTDVELRSFPQVDQHDEDYILTRLLYNSVNPAHTVTCTRGLCYTGIDQVLGTLESHLDLSLYAMIMNNEAVDRHFRPLMQKPTDPHCSGKFERGVFDLVFGSKNPRWRTARGPYYPERDIAIFGCQWLEWNDILFTAKPKSLGVYAKTSDGEVAVAVLCDRAVARLRINEER